MARIRTIKPEFFQDEPLSSCSPHARLLAIALLQLCDRQGVFLCIPMQVHAHAFPWETSVDIQVLLGELERVGYVKLYRVSGKPYGYIPGFTKHQRITGKEADSKALHPLPDVEGVEDQSFANGKHLGVSPGNNGEISRCPGKGKEEREKEVGIQDSSERSPRSKPVDDSPVVHVLKPLVGKQPELAITEKQVETFMRAYPGADVRAELRRMNAWLEANPQRRKTANGALKFVNGWLSRVQDNAKPAASTGPPRKLSPAEIMAQALKEFAEEDD